MDRYLPNANGQTSAVGAKKWALGIALWLILLTLIMLVPVLPLAADKPLKAPFLVHESKAKALIFFGFSKCLAVCPTSLSSLSRTLGKLEESQWPAVYFIDIDENSSQALADNYAQQFHASFNALHPSRSLMKQLSAEFGLNIRKGNGDIDHSGRTYLLERRSSDWWLSKAYNPGPISLALIRDELI